MALPTEDIISLLSGYQSETYQPMVSSTLAKCKQIYQTVNNCSIAGSHVRLLVSSLAGHLAGACFNAAVIFYNGYHDHTTKLCVVLIAFGIGSSYRICAKNA